MRQQINQWRQAAVAILITGLVLGTAAPATGEQEGNDAFLAGAAAVDVSPEHLPAIVNGGFLRRTADTVHDPLYARALVLSPGDAAARIAIVVVDSCMLPRDLIDEAKTLAEEQTGIPPARVLVSATHTHSAPAAMGALGCEVDPNYAPMLPDRIAEAIAAASDRLAPAQVGSAIVPAVGHTHSRRWVYRPGVVHTDPFGEATVRANMHPGPNPPDAIGPSGPIDDDLALIAVRNADDHRPIALIGSYGMHYFGTGVPAVSADYFGIFVDRVQEAWAEQHDEPGVAMMAQGTSGDTWWRDYSRDEHTREVNEYAQAMADLALRAYEQMSFDASPAIAAAATDLTLDRRTPDDDRLAWAHDIIEQMGDRHPQNRPEVYAREQIYLYENPQATLKLQALRVGELTITAIPNEVYAITGLKLKAKGPGGERVMNISLANGSQGYIPPPEQHSLGGYNTWPARTAALEEQAEPQIVATLLDLMEQVTDQPRRDWQPAQPPYVQAVLDAGPAAFYRLGELSGPTALDASPGGFDGTYEPRVALGLPGVFIEDDPDRLVLDRTLTRAALFAGGRMVGTSAADLNLGDAYSVELWFRSGVADDVYPVTGYVFSLGVDGDDDAAGGHLGIGGAHADVPEGRLFFYNGDAAGDVVAGSTRVERGRWHHAVLVREGDQVTLYLDGEPEAAGEAPVTRDADAADATRVFLGARNDAFGRFPGHIAEAAIYDRPLNATEIRERYHLAR